jgi:hypothetical protein
MPFVNPLTGKKRRRSTNRTSRNNRSHALDAYDSMVVRALHKRIESLMELLSSCLVAVSLYFNNHTHIFFLCIFSQQVSPGHSYVFTNEEIMLFVLRKYKTGHCNVELVN